MKVEISHEVSNKTVAFFTTYFFMNLTEIVFYLYNVKLKITLVVHSVIIGPG